MNTSSRVSTSRVITILLGCLTAIIGFVAFNVVDGIFGVPEALLGIAVCVATTVLVFRRSPRGEEKPDV